MKKIDVHVKKKTVSRKDVPPRVAPRLEGVVKNAGIKEKKKPKK